MVRPTQTFINRTAHHSPTTAHPFQLHRPRITYCSRIFPSSITKPKLTSEGVRSIMNTISQSRTKIELTASNPTVEYSWRSLPGTGEAETEARANPQSPSTKSKSKWTCTLCHSSMLSNDTNAHINGKRHVAALAKASNIQIVPTSANTEAEANPPISPGKLPWTCTLCLTTMILNDVTAHINGKRHIAALERAGNAQPGPMTATTPAEANPPSPAENSYWTCTLCLITMSSKDSTAHKRGKRHMTALAKVGEVQSGPMATPSLQPNFPYPEPDIAVAMGRTKTSTSAKSLAKVQIKKAHTTVFSKKTAKSPLEDNNDPLMAFFALYSPFKYNPSNSAHQEYQRLRAFFGWPSPKQEEKHAERDEAWEGFRIAMVKAFNVTFGNDEKDIEAWGRMCVLVGIEDIPDTLKARREAMMQTHVNLCDLLDSTRQRSQVKVFSSDIELRAYTVRTGNFFPLYHAYAGGLLKYLLREIKSKYFGYRVPRGLKKGKKIANSKEKNEGSGRRA